MSSQISQRLLDLNFSSGLCRLILAAFVLAQASCSADKSDDEGTAPVETEDQTGESEQADEGSSDKQQADSAEEQVAEGEEKQVYRISESLPYEENKFCLVTIENTIDTDYFGNQLIVEAGVTLIVGGSEKDKLYGRTESGEYVWVFRDPNMTSNCDNLPAGFRETNITTMFTIDTVFAYNRDNYEVPLCSLPRGIRVGVGSDELDVSGPFIDNDASIDGAVLVGSLVEQECRQTEVIIKDSNVIQQVAFLETVN
jgi:hypothetical protein